VRKLKKKEWINGNKMLFESEHKTFNKYIRCVSPGNVLGCGQTSLYIRPYNKDNGKSQQWDLQNWRELPYYIEEYVKKQTKTKPAILYKFWYRTGNKQITIGYVLTRPTKTGYELLDCWNTAGTLKSKSALQECMKYIVGER